MCSPSGDQRGVVTSGPLNEVNFTTFKPSLSHTQISRLLERSEQKAIFFPSGENSGYPSIRVDEISIIGRLVLAFRPGNSKRQMFVS